MFDFHQSDQKNHGNCLTCHLQNDQTIFEAASLVFLSSPALDFQTRPFSSSSCYCLIMTVITTAHIIECLLCAKHSAVCSIDTLLISSVTQISTIDIPFYVWGNWGLSIVASEERTGSSSRWLDLKRMNDMWTLSSKDKTHQACLINICGSPHSMRKWKHSTEGEWGRKVNIAIVCNKNPLMYTLTANSWMISFCQQSQSFLNPHEITMKTIT